MLISIPADPTLLIPENGKIDEFWRDAVRHGESHAKIALPIVLEKYLVMLLMEYLNDANIMDTPIAIHFLEGIEKNNLPHLRRAASVALLILGLFPERTNRMLVSPSYLLMTGKSSYDHLAFRLEAIRETDDAQIARHARDAFEPMARVLRGMRMNENVFAFPLLP